MKQSPTVVANRSVSTCVERKALRLRDRVCLFEVNAARTLAALSANAPDVADGHLPICGLTCRHGTPA